MLGIKQWRTNAMGQFTTRGHRGLYEVSLEFGDRKTTMPCDAERGTGLLRVVQ